jgi:hypothetical protein
MKAKPVPSAFVAMRWASLQSVSFRQTLDLMPILKLSPWGSASLAQRCLQAIQDNDQISKAWGQEQALREIVEGWT